MRVDRWSRTQCTNFAEIADWENGYQWPLDLFESVQHSLAECIDKLAERGLPECWWGIDSWHWNARWSWCLYKGTEDQGKRWGQIQEGWGQGVWKGFPNKWEAICVGGEIRWIATMGSTKTIYLLISHSLVQRSHKGRTGAAAGGRAHRNWWDGEENSITQGINRWGTHQGQ